MKSTTTVLNPVPACDRAWLADLCELTKARLTTLVLLTTLLGFYMGQVGSTNYLLLVHTLLGTAWLAGGAAALNQLWERDCDARMHRTANRPLPAGRISPETALGFGLATAALGLVELFWGVNLPAGCLGAATLISYVLIYTPLKRRTSWNTLVGAVPGALPPLIGWAAARGSLPFESWSLFAIQFLWQVPHFLAIAWLYRDDYSRGGYCMLPIVDPSGRWTGWTALLHALCLLPVSLAPFWLGLTGPLYVWGACALSGIFLWFAWQFCFELSPRRARGLFYASLLYLPLVFMLMVADKL